MYHAFSQIWSWSLGIYYNSGFQTFNTRGPTKIRQKCQGLTKQKKLYLMKIYKIFSFIFWTESSVFYSRAGILLLTQEPRLQFCPKAGLPLQTQEPKLCRFPIGINSYGSFPLLSAPHSLASEQISKDPRGLNLEVRIVDLANWVPRISPKFTRTEIR